MVDFLGIGVALPTDHTQARWMIAGAVILAVLSLLVLRVAVSRARREKRRELVAAWHAGANQRPGREPPRPAGAGR